MLGQQIRLLRRARHPPPAGEPGDVIRLQLDQPVRRLHHLADDVPLAGRRPAATRAVTGIVTYPDAAPPSAGWPVVSTANGTSGMQTDCAGPSRYDQPAARWGLQAVGVNSDYIGLGPVGELHPYLSRISEAHSVIYVVARRPEHQRDGGAGAPDGWRSGVRKAVTRSISTNELARSWAPELDLVGSVAFAPGAMFGNSYGDIDAYRRPASISVMMPLYGAATRAEHPNPDPTDDASPTTATAGRWRAVDGAPQRHRRRGSP